MQNANEKKVEEDRKLTVSAKIQQMQKSVRNSYRTLFTKVMRAGIKP